VTRIKPTTDEELSYLFGAWPPEEMKDGDLIDYDSVVAVIDIEHGSNRWNTITRRWRRALKKHGIELVSEYGRGFIVSRSLSPVERIERKLDRLILMVEKMKK
jgi:hypothetical protein